MRGQEPRPAGSWSARPPMARDHRPWALLVPPLRGWAGESHRAIGVEGIHDEPGDLSKVHRIRYWRRGSRRPDKDPPLVLVSRIVGVHRLRLDEGVEVGKDRDSRGQEV